MKIKIENVCILMSLVLYYFNYIDSSDKKFQEKYRKVFIMNIIKGNY